MAPYCLGELGANRLIWVLPKTGVPQIGWFIMENPIEMDDLGRKPTIFGNPHIYISWDMKWRSISAVTKQRLSSNGGGIHQDHHGRHSIENRMRDLNGLQNGFFFLAHQQKKRGIQSNIPLFVSNLFFDRNSNRELYFCLYTSAYTQGSST